MRGGGEKGEFGPLSFWVCSCSVTHLLRNAPTGWCYHTKHLSSTLQSAIHLHNLLSCRSPAGALWDFQAGRQLLWE